MPHVARPRLDVLDLDRRAEDRLELGDQRQQVGARAEGEVHRLGDVTRAIASAITSVTVPT